MRLILQSVWIGGSTNPRLTTSTFSFLRGPPRARDLLCAHQQSNSICNELRCSQKVEGCKSERKVAFFDIWVRSEVARLMVLTGKRSCYDEHKQNKPSLPGRKKKKDQGKRATTSEPHFCTWCRWQPCRRLTSKVENHWKM